MKTVLKRLCNLEIQSYTVELMADCACVCVCVCVYIYIHIYIYIYQINTISLENTQNGSAIHYKPLGIHPFSLRVVVRVTTTTRTMTDHICKKNMCLAVLFL